MRKNEAIINLTYEGPSLGEGEMNAVDLGNAISSFGQLLFESNKILNKNTELSIKVKSIKRGSVLVDFLLNFGHGDLVISLLNSKETNAAIHLCEILGFVGTFGLFPLLKMLERRTVKKIIESESFYVLHLSSDEEIQVEKKLFSLYSNSLVRNSIENLVFPLKREGVTSLKIKSALNIFEIPKNELFFYEVGSSKEKISSNLDIAWLVLDTVNFSGGKWKVLKDKQPIFVSIEDRAFNKKIENGEENFRNGDMLKVNLSSEYYITDTGLKIEYVIVEVLQHVIGHTQQGF